MSFFKTALFILTLVFFFGCKKNINNCTSNQMNELVAHYPLDGNIDDMSGYGNNGILSGPTPAMDRNQEENAAYYFDGDKDMIQILDNEQLYFSCELTLSVWIKPETGKSQQIIRKGAHVNGEYSWPFGLSLSGTNDMIFSITTENGELTQARKAGYEVNTWYLMTGTLKDEVMKLYINGELEVVEEINGKLVDDPLPLLIGTRLQLPSSTFQGIIDEIRIYDYALNDQEIFELYNN